MENPFNTPRWKWRLERARRAAAGLRGRLAPRHGGGTRHALCAECGGLVARGERECSRCGAPAAGAIGQAAGRVARMLSPGGCPASFLLLAANLAVALLSLRPDPRWLMALMDAGSLIPVRVTAEGEWHRVLSYGYLHGNVLHLGFNMIGLFQMGALLEPHIGTRRFFTLYTLAMLGGAAADLAFRGQEFLLIVGASGALCGLIGGGLAHAHLSGDRVVRDALLNWILMMVVYAVVFEIVGGVHVDHLAHAGGLVTGLVVGGLVFREESVPPGRLRRGISALWTLATLALLALTAAGLWRAALALRVPAG